MYCTVVGTHSAVGLLKSWMMAASCRLTYVFNNEFVGLGIEQSSTVCLTVVCWVFNSYLM